MARSSQSSAFWILGATLAGYGLIRLALRSRNPVLREWEPAHSGLMDDQVDASSVDSMDASDPPSWTPAHV